MRGKEEEERKQLKTPITTIWLHYTTHYNYPDCKAKQLEYIIIACIYLGPFGQHQAAAGTELIYA